MIDEREIVASKIWRDVLKIQRTHGISDDEINKLAMLVSSAIYISQSDLNFQNDIFNELKGELSEISRGYELSQPKNFSSKWMAAEKRIRAAIGNANEYIWMKFEEDTVRDVAEAIWSLSLGISDVEYFFEAAFRRYINSSNLLDFKIGRKVAHLASHFSSSKVRLVDYFMESGDFAVLAIAKTRKKKEVHTLELPADDFALRLRLAMRNIEVRARAEVPESDDSFILINHPRHLLSRKQSLENFQRPFDICALEGLDRLLQGEKQFGWALAVIPGIDRSAKGFRRDMRRYIAERNLIAVIDIPFSTSNAAKIRTVSAWLISGAQRDGDEILFIDANKALRATTAENYSEAMRFVADIVKIWHPKLSKDVSANIVEGSRDFEGMFRHEFRDGYRNVAGLCKIVTFDELQRSDWNLTANKYVFEHVGRQSKLPTLDSNPVLDVLFHNRNRPTRIYVIGNNGEGKSLLLTELIEHLSLSGIPTVGLSFGLTDRFPFSRKSTEGRASFIYVGARTAEKAVALRSTNRTLVHYMKAIQSEQTRLDVFLEVMDLLGFRHSIFLVPVGYRASEREIFKDTLSNVALLTDNAEENIELLEGKSANAYALGLMRKGSRNEIVIFEELSSGEQQLLNIAIKLIATGNLGTVMLVDEPEISLHVSWQRAIPEVFELISENLQCSIVVATHSPIVMASAVKPRDYCFAAQDRTLVQILTKKNQSVDAVLFDNFKTYTRQTRRVHELCAAMVAKAIKSFNSEDSNIESDSDLLVELDGIINVIRSSPTGISHEQLARDLALVEKTRAAIIQMRS